MRIKLLLVLCTGILLASGEPAIAAGYDWTVTAHVTTVETSASPASIDFMIDQSAGTCAAGTLLYWLPPHHTADVTSQAQNASAAISVLMTAAAAGKTVTLYGSNSGCEVNFLYMNTS